MGYKVWVILDGYESRDVDIAIGPFIGDVSNGRGLERYGDFVLHGL